LQHFDAVQNVTEPVSVEQAFTPAFKRDEESAPLQSAIRLTLL